MKTNIDKTVTAQEKHDEMTSCLEPPVAFINAHEFQGSFPSTLSKRIQNGLDSPPVAGTGPRCVEDHVYFKLLQPDLNHFLCTSLPAFVMYFFLISYFAWLNMVMANVWKLTV